MDCADGGDDDDDDSVRGGPLGKLPGAGDVHCLPDRSLDSVGVGIPKRSASTRRSRLGRTTGVSGGV